MHTEKHDPVQLFPYSFVFDNRRTWLIWCSRTGEKDCFLRIPDSTHLVHSETKAGLRAELGDMAKDVCWDEDGEIDFDVFWRRLNNLRTTRASRPDTCSILLDGFNFLDDAVRSLRGPTIGKQAELSRDTYDKLFFGCNLPSVTPKGSAYRPKWSERDIRNMRTTARHVWSMVDLGKLT